MTGVHNKLVGGDFTYVLCSGRNTPLMMAN